MSIMKELFDYAKVKFQLNQIHRMIKALHYAFKEQDRRLKIIESDLKTFLDDSYPKKIHDDRYESLDSRQSVTEAFIDNLEKIELFDKDIAN